MEPVNLKRLAKELNLAISTVSRALRDSYDISPETKKRVFELAQKLIREKSGSLSDVAYALSFTDQAHFSNAFKKVTGMCPKEFLIKRY